MFSKLTGSSQRGSATSGGEQDGDSLDKILPSSEDKLEFVLLVMLCTDRMRENIDAVFNPSITAFPKPAPPTSPWQDPKDAPSDIPPTYSQATKDLGQDDYLRRKRDLSSTQMKEMHKDAVSAFAKFRIQVLKRTGEVLKVSANAANTERARRADLGTLGVLPIPPEDLIDVGDISSTEQTLSDHRHAKIPSSLIELDKPKRVLLLNSLLLLLLSLERYSAYSRVLLLLVASSLDLPPTMVTEHEDKVAEGLLKGAKAQMDAEASRKRENNKDSGSRAWKVRLATVAGAALIGVTGGLAAPFLAGAMGTVLGGIGLGGTAIAGLLGTLAGNFVVVGAIFGAYGGSMTGDMMKKYAKEVEDFTFIPLRKVDEDKHRLRVAIGISGWLSTKEERYLPWLVLGDRIESFCLQWELEILLKLGESLMQTFKELAVRYAAVEIIKRTVFAGLLVALWPLGLLKIGKMLSNSFSVAQVRADKAGEVLADALIHKAQGERPVTLIGYSLGARVIYSCLRTLAERRAFGLVESVILMGLPASAESQNWRSVRAVVVDRVVNVYSRNDYILGLVYRTSSITPDVAGLQPIEEVAGMENVDVSELVSGHLRYRFLVGAILDRVGYETLDREQLQKEHAALERLDAQEEQMKREQKAKEMAQNGKRKSNRQAGEFEWDEMLQGNQDAGSLDKADMEVRLREVKLQEEEQGLVSPVTSASQTKLSVAASKSGRSGSSPSSGKVSPLVDLPNPIAAHADLPKTNIPLTPSQKSQVRSHQIESKDETGIPPWKQPKQPVGAQETGEKEQIPPWKLGQNETKTKQSQEEPLQSLHPEAEISDDEFAGHRIAMVDDSE